MVVVAVVVDDVVEVDEEVEVVEEAELVEEVEVAEEVEVVEEVVAEVGVENVDTVVWVSAEIELPTEFVVAAVVDSTEIQVYFD